MIGRSYNEAVGRQYAVTVLILACCARMTNARTSLTDRSIDLSKSVVLKSRIRCDGVTAPEDYVTARATFSPGSSERQFSLYTFERGNCKFDLKVVCIGTPPLAWNAVWSSSNNEPPKPDAFTLRSCYEWGSAQPAQYVISAWYREAEAKRFTPWRQVYLKQVSAHPDVFEFKDPTGATGRLELNRR
jgi:hypothetical protein